MTDGTRLEAWQTLSDFFKEIYAELQLGERYSIVFQSGHYKNESFPFGAYAGYAVGERQVVISFDLADKGGWLSLSADISREDEVPSSHSSDNLLYIFDPEENLGPYSEQKFRQLISTFIAACKKAVPLIREQLFPGAASDEN